MLMLYANCVLYVFKGTLFHGWVPLLVCTSFPIMPCRQAVSVATAQEVARNGWKSVTQQTEEVFMLFDFVNHYTVVAKLYTTWAPLYVQL